MAYVACSVRRIYCAWLLFNTVLQARDHIVYAKLQHFRNKGVRKPPARFLGMVQMPLLSIPMCILTLGSFQLCLLGVCVDMNGILSAPVCLFAANILYFLHFSQVLDLEYVQEKASLIPFVLFFLALDFERAGIFSYDFATFASRDELTPACAWPLLAVKILLAHSYFSSAVMKLRRTGLKWVNGETLQGFLLLHYLSGDNRVAGFIGARPWLCRTMSCCGLLFELSSPLLATHPSTGAAFAVLGVSFHVGCYVVLGVNFLSYFVPSYAVYAPDILQTMLPYARQWFNYSGIEVRSTPCDLSAAWLDLASTPTVSTAGAAVLAAVLTATMVYHCVMFARVTYWEHSAMWPLFSWDLYSVPPPEACYSCQVPGKLDTAVVTSCRVVLEHGDASDEMPQEEFMKLLWSYDARSVSYAHLVLYVAPKELVHVAKFFGLDLGGRGAAGLERLDLLDHIVATALRCKQHVLIDALAAVNEVMHK
ncbi:hypothetical protein CYMTET_43763 [Cymbomonas tetramitiformis]|uniref:HTTM domain-containing protein n=1 Tax=Cymbomonas tetramitiformis TaxID=36881 RepID=A0AAE0EZN5_9CHLO|nr:hypothetical protein CYMTET_43763 [Cymbomonas tetramitiformis]